ncbi:MAG: hypothetical protein EOP11_21070 [Proteobacteria bacterium]|nr:MAG: hypothetical protein EOP11_21070 [Pseudomonadota bacterium]
MFANLSNPMAYIITFQLAVLLVPAAVGLFHTLREERRSRFGSSPLNLDQASGVDSYGNSARAA